MHFGCESHWLGDQFFYVGKEEKKIGYINTFI